MYPLSWHDRGRLWLRLGLRLALTIAALWVLLRLGPPLASLFAPFLLALLTAWALAPAVRALHDHFHISRKFLSLTLLLGVFALLSALLWALAAAGVGELLELAGNWESLMVSLQEAVQTMDGSLSRVMDALPPAVRSTADGIAEQFFRWLETAIPRLLTGAVDRLAGIAAGAPSFAVAAVVFLMAAYLLTAGYPGYRDALTAKLPAGPRRLLSLLRRAAREGVGGYLRAEILLSAGVFAILLGGLLLIRQPYALLLALTLAVLDFIPIVGSGTAMVPWAAFDVLTGQLRHGMGILAVWGLVALFRRLAEPKVLGRQTGLSPLLSLASVYVGMRVAGVLGMLLGPVLCLTARSVWQGGVLDRPLADLRLACRDLAAILREDN